MSWQVLSQPYAYIRYRGHNVCIQLNTTLTHVPYIYTYVILLWLIKSLYSGIQVQFATHCYITVKRITYLFSYTLRHTVTSSHFWLKGLNNNVFMYRMQTRIQKCSVSNAIYIVYRLWSIQIILSKYYISIGYYTYTHMMHNRAYILRILT
jgi:hypothetical protein